MTPEWRNNISWKDFLIDLILLSISVVSTYVVAAWVICGGHHHNTPMLTLVSVVATVGVLFLGAALIYCLLQRHHVVRNQERVVLIKQQTKTEEDKDKTM